MSDEKPITSRNTGRIDLDLITLEFGRVMPQAKEASDLDSFIAVVLPVIHGNIRKYWFLLDGERYVQGEFACLLEHIRDCVTGILPPHLPYVPDIRGDELVFVPR